MGYSFQRNKMKEILRYIRSDFYRYKGERHGIMYIIIYALFSWNHSFRYSFWYRMASRKSILYPIAVYMHNHYSAKYGIQIPRYTRIGYGLYLGHGIGIVVNYETKIGNNCNISHFVSIGTNNNNPAIIGDNVYIGPNVSIVENVNIGNNVTIGAGAVVVKDIPENATVAGVPATVISYKFPGKFITNKVTCDIY